MVLVSLNDSMLHCLIDMTVEDESEDRREVVRRKTAKYLLKAEQLYSNYLNSTTSHDNVYDWDVRE